MDNIGFEAKYSPDSCSIPNVSSPGRVSVLPKVFMPPETLYSGAGPVTYTVLLAVRELYCGLRPDNQHKSSFVLLNASILGKYSEKSFL